MAEAETEIWPDIPYANWADSRATLHLWTQIVGKVVLALAPHVNHWWQVTFTVTGRGLTTRPVPHGGRIVQFTFDFIDHALVIQTSGGKTEIVPLQPRTVADFYAEVMGRLHSLGMDVRIWSVPVEIPDPVPFEADREHRSYDGERVNCFWHALAQADRVLRGFRGRFIGKASPVHFFWGSFDLAASRFSGRRAPPHPSVPNASDRVTLEAYSHEVASCGFWPGGAGMEEPAFYAYAYPEPPGFAQAPVPIDGAFYSSGFGEFLLPYDRVRRAAFPDDVLLDFAQSTYEAAATQGQWDRVGLERQNP